MLSSSTYGLMDKLWELTTDEVAVRLVIGGTLSLEPCAEAGGLIYTRLVTRFECVPESNAMVIGQIMRREGHDHLNIMK